mgnify:CR=1 FL=1
MLLTRPMRLGAQGTNHRGIVSVLLHLLAVQSVVVAVWAKFPSHDSNSNQLDNFSETNASNKVPKNDLLKACLTCIIAIGHVNVNVESFLLIIIIIIQYRPTSLENYWLTDYCQSEFECNAYKHHWEFPINKKITPVLTSPITEKQQSVRGILNFQICGSFYNVPN